MHVHKVRSRERHDPGVVTHLGILILRLYTLGLRLSTVLTALQSSSFDEQ